MAARGGVVAEFERAIDRQQHGLGRRALAGAYINVIKAFAEATNNENVYVLAGVSPNDAPGVVPPSNTAESFTANVNPDGSITVKWKASQPAGVTGVQYNVHRRCGFGLSWLCEVHRTPCAVDRMLRAVDQRSFTRAEFRYLTARRLRGGDQKPRLRAGKREYRVGSVAGCAGRRRTVTLWPRVEMAMWRRHLRAIALGPVTHHGVW